MTWARAMTDPAFKWVLLISAGAILVVVLSAVSIVAVQLDRGEAFVCPDGSILSKSCAIEHFPKHAVVAFKEGIKRKGEDEKEKCPDGWEEYDQAEGRFIIGAGRRNGFEIGMRESGGEYRVKLEIEHMPRHKHENPSRGWEGRGSKEEVQALQATDKGEYGGTHARPTDFVGEGLPHNNMPPYIALLWCKKV